MKSKNTTYKIEKIYNQEVTSENEIIIFGDETTEVKNAVKNTENINNIKNNIVDFSTDWEDLNTYTMETFTDNIYAMHKEFRIALPDMPTKYLPFINIEIIYKCNDIYPINQMVSLFSVKKNHFFQVGNADDNIASNITLVAGFSIMSSNLGFEPFSMQAKILVKLFNPETYL